LNSDVEGARSMIHCGTRTRPVLAGAVHTGRQLVLFPEGVSRSVAEALRIAAGIRFAVSSDFDRAAPRTDLALGEGLLFERVGAALIHGDPDQARSLARRADRQALIIEPERYVRASGAVRPLSDAALPLRDTAFETWGLKATRVLSSRYSGHGVRVAILDTGFDLGHPDFAGRAVVSRSFVAGLPVDDANGHGTFCAGVACGPGQPGDAPRYGVASAAELHVARVLGDDASGTDGEVLAGIDWAVRHGCAVISISLGSPVYVGDRYPEVYEHVAARALAAGSLLVAPAGNESQRPDTIAPVEHPANCPSIVAVGALDQSLEVAPFSNGGLNPNGGEVSLVAPGIAIVSAAPRPDFYQVGSGTSMATPFVAGIAALLAEARPEARGAALRDLLLEALRELPAPMRDVGAGLVQAPQ
jgi:subtilisin